MQRNFPNKMTEKEQDEQLILDGTKLAWHKERVEAWLRGERIAPITIDCALTRACTYNCVYCYGKLQDNDSKRMTWPVIKRFLDDAAEIGVKAISFVSDGESTCSPYLYDAIIYGHEKGLNMALGTNGALLKKEKLKEILPCLTYLRFNISAGESKRYSEIHGCKEEDFFKVIEIIKECARIKKENKLTVTIGLQMVLLPEFKDQILPLANLGKEIHADYLVIKHCSDDETGSLGVDYKKYFDEGLTNTIKQAEALSDENYFVKAKWSKILSGGKRNYSRCYGPPFIIQLSGSGLVAPCGMFFNDKYKKYHIGNICDISFKEMFRGQRYWEVMDLIASDKFDAKTMCGTLCLQHNANESLNKIKSGEIKYSKPEGKPPQHINFI
jgi:MoaA/NifB/PqqE/SkfB family radical SAM enzyme